MFRNIVLKENLDLGDVVLLFEEVFGFCVVGIVQGFQMGCQNTPTFHELWQINQDFSYEPVGEYFRPTLLHNHRTGKYEWRYTGHNVLHIRNENEIRERISRGIRNAMESRMLFGDQRSDLGEWVHAYVSLDPNRP